MFISQNAKFGRPTKNLPSPVIPMTQVWNKQGKFRVGSYWAYRDEKAFIDCQKLLNGIPQDEDNPSIANADRGVVRLHWQAES